jgi:hypothetical protein
METNLGYFSKAIGATVGAAFAWAAVFGLGDGTTLFGISQAGLEPFITMLGAFVGTWFAPKNTA